MRSWLCMFAMWHSEDSEFTRIASNLNFRSKHALWASDCTMILASYATNETRLWEFASSLTFTADAFSFTPQTGHDSEPTTRRSSQETLLSELAHDVVQ
jgi:hypothetical protein